MSDETTMIEPDDATEDARNFAEDSPETPRRGRGPTGDDLKACKLIRELKDEEPEVRILATDAGLDISGMMHEAAASVTRAESMLSIARAALANVRRAEPLASKFAALPEFWQGVVRRTFEDGGAA